MLQALLPDAPYPIADRSLAQRLERAEGAANAASVEAHATYEPTSAAEWLDVAGVYAMFDGLGSPLTQTFGLGVCGELTEADLDQLEAFFFDRGSPVFHEVSPLISPELLQTLTRRGYMPVELSNVLYRPTGVANHEVNTSVRVRLIQEHEAELWASITGRGWSPSPPKRPCSWNTLAGSWLGRPGCAASWQRKEEYPLRELPLVAWVTWPFWPVLVLSRMPAGVEHNAH